MATGLKPVTQRTVDGNPILDHEEEEVMHVQPSVSIALGNHPLVSPGTLHITSKRIIWLSDTDKEKGFAVDFVSVSLHAISRDAEAYPSPCLYAQIETGAEDEEQEESDSDSDETLNLSKITEMRLVPSEPSQLDTLFAIFCECAELNPDPVEAEEEGGNNWFFSADQLDGECGEDGDLEWPVFQNPNHTIGANGHDLASSVLQLQINDQRFEDAEEMEQEDKNGTDQHTG